MKNRYLNALIYFIAILVGGFFSKLIIGYIFDNLSVSTIKTIMSILSTILIATTGIALIFKRRLKKHGINHTL
jgi:hypothetical protein